MAVASRPSLVAHASDDLPADVSTGQVDDVRVLEREAELGRIDQALARAQAHQGTLLVLEGAAGIGKSSLIEAAADAARAAGIRVLRARGGELERDFAFGVARQLLEPALAATPASRRADLFQGPAGVAARMLALPGADADAGEAEAPDASFAVLHGLYWLCANLAGDDPLVITVDDAHWADPASLRFLAFLLPRLEELAFAIVVAARPQPEPVAGGMLGALLADRTACILRPSPLSEPAVARLIEAELGETPAPSFTAACHRATGGLPFLVRELLSAMRDEHVEPTADRAAQVDALGARTLGRTILLRLGRLPATAIRLAGAVAVLETAHLHQAADLAGIDLVAAAEAVDLLVGAGVFEPRQPLAFVHPIVRAAVLEEVPQAERLRAHRRAAELLAARNGRRRARGRAPGRERATGRPVGRRAAHRGRPDGLPARCTRVGCGLPAPCTRRAPGARGARADPVRARRRRGDRRANRTARPGCARRSPRPATTAPGSVRRSCSRTCWRGPTRSARRSTSSTSPRPASRTPAAPRSCCSRRWR